MRLCILASSPSIILVCCSQSQRPEKVEKRTEKGIEVVLNHLEP